MNATATATPKHRADGPATEGGRAKPGRHQTDRTGTTR
jgi:hypothetical protein